MEELYSIRRKYADKWLNFGRIYVIRANLALFAEIIGKI
jgi:hypothetical protein